jgi:hypothetical protein
MSKKRKKKLALKRETLRKLDNSELQGAAGGYIYTTKYCAGGNTQAGATGGCTDDAIRALDGSIVIKQYG